MTKTRLVFPVLAALAALALLAGCGGGGGDSSGADPASVAPPESGLFVEGIVQPTGELKTNVESVFNEATGIEGDLGELIVSKLEEAASASGEPFDFEKEVQPWLGERAGMAFEEYDGDNFSGFVVAVQTTDSGAAQEFVESAAEKGEQPAEEGSYEGVDFEVEGNDGTTLGMVGDLLVVAQSEAGFKEAVDASEGENLSEVETYESLAPHAPSGSLLDAYVDIGGLIEQAGNEVDPQVEDVLKTAGIELDEAAALLSLVPGSAQLELDVASNLGDEVVTPPAGKLLESMPGDSLAAVGASDYGQRVEEGIDKLDAEGIQEDVPPHQLKKTLKALGINVEKLVDSLDEAAIFAVGSSRSTLGGALVLTTTDAAEAKSTVSNIGFLLRSNHTPGVTAVSGKAAGFSIHSDELGPKPLVIATKDDRIAIGYGLPSTLEGLGPVSTPLSENASFVEAKKALGSTPISGFVDGSAALRLAENLVPRANSGFQSARPYLDKISYVGFGSGTEGDLATLKLVAGLGK